ncbi:hypothetical protein Tco_1215109 [Tanacetum coccineum]
MLILYYLTNSIQRNQESQILKASATLNYISSSNVYVMMISRRIFKTAFKISAGMSMSFQSSEKGKNTSEAHQVNTPQRLQDKETSAVYTYNECLILSPSFKLLDESQVVLRAPRQNGVYSLDLKNIFPSGGEHVPLLPAMLAGASPDQGEGSAIPAGSQPCVGAGPIRVFLEQSIAAIKGYRGGSGENSINGSELITSSGWLLASAVLAQMVHLVANITFASIRSGVMEITSLAQRELVIVVAIVGVGVAVVVVAAGVVVVVGVAVVLRGKIYGYKAFISSIVK